MKIINCIRSYINKHISGSALQFIFFTDAVVLCGLFLAAIPALFVSSFFLWIFLGGFLSFWNFFFLAVFIQKYFNSKLLGTNVDKFLPFGQILISNLRLFLTGILLYSFLVHWKADPIALLIGVSIPVATIPILLVYKNKN